MGNAHSTNLIEIPKRTIYACNIALIAKKPIVPCLEFLYVVGVASGIIAAPLFGCQSGLLNSLLVVGT